MFDSPLSHWHERKEEGKKPQRQFRSGKRILTYWEKQQLIDEQPDELWEMHL